MKSFKSIDQIIQGDIAITRITALPQQAIPEISTNHEYIVAHSETGHHHVVDSNGSVMYNDSDNTLVSYLVVEDTAQIIHNRAYNTHETIECDAGVYRINRQREYTPDGYRRVAD